MYQSFKGGLGGIALAKHGRSRAINAENPHGEKGKGGMAASHLGPSRKGSPCLNNFFTPLFYSNGIQVLSVSIVQLPLRDNMYGVPWDLVSAMGWIILLPIIIFVAVFEKQIMDGIMAGGVKA